MTARVLIVDDIFANIKLLEVKLQAEYFEVITAMNGKDALHIAEQGLCDIVLLDVMMPEMDGFEVCRRLKSNEETHHLPVVMVTALDQPAEKVRGLEVGADDFLTKPIDDVALITRVRNLVRLKVLTDELRGRANTVEPQNSLPSPAEMEQKANARAKILLVDDRPSSAERVIFALEDYHDVIHEADPQHSIFRLTDENFDVAIINMALDGFDGLRLIGQIRSLERLRNLPLITIFDQEDRAKLLRAMDMGVNDYVLRPVDNNEMKARIRTQMRKKYFTDYLRNSMQNTVEMAFTDALTGLNNRRFLENHLSTQIHAAKERQKPLTLVILDIDHFKIINDTHGHDIGDQVLREFSNRLKKIVRGQDVAVRFGGEEFMIVMPETDMLSAAHVAERIRRQIEEKSFVVGADSRQLNVTCSIGISKLYGIDDTSDGLIKRADQALYRAKKEGRNRVVIADAA